MKSKTFCHVWDQALNPIKLIILVMCMVPVAALGCDGEPLYPETVTIEIEVNAI